MTALLSLVSKFKVWFGIAGAVVIAIGIAFLRGRAAGIQHLEAEQARRRIESMQTRKDVEDDISELGSQDVDERLARWNRDE